MGPQAAKPSGLRQRQDTGYQPVLHRREALLGVIYAAADQIAAAHRNAARHVEGRRDWVHRDVSRLERDIT